MVVLCLSVEHFEVVKLLVREGANIENKDKDLSTALHYACFAEGSKASKSESTETVANIAVFLILSRADINIKNAEGFPPLHYCSKKLGARLASLVEMRDSDINFLISKQ